MYDRLNNLQGDIVAGLTVGLMVIPQGLAYAKIAGLPEQYGLYSAFMGCFIYCFFGSSKVRMEFDGVAPLLLDIDY